MDKLKIKKEQLQTLKLGKGLQYLVNEACKILGNPVLTHDMEYKVIAYTEGIVTDDPIWNEFDSMGTVSLERLEFYKTECFLDTAANAQKITFLRSEQLKYDRIYGKLFNKENIQIGCACIPECCKPFDDDDPILFEYFCDILDKELAKNRFYSDYGQAYQETLINELLEDSIEDKEAYAAHIESIYINLKSHIYLAVADISSCNHAQARPAYFRDLLKRALPTFKYSLYNDYVVIIISSDNATLDIKRDLGKLNRLLKQHHIYAGISGCFDNLFELRKHYLQAVDVLDDGLKHDDGKWVFLHNEAN